MNPITAPYFQFKQRIGLHYFPDTLHYREQDYNTWLPVLKSLHISWIVLVAPKDRAIPEAFIKGLEENKIEPLLHITDFPINKREAENLEPMIEAYAHWGINQIIFFNQPNMRSAWSVREWTQKNLMDQFLEKFSPAAKLALKYQIKPVFPPLYPGGDYWDTIFLKSALTKISETDGELLENLQLASYVWTWGHSLNWGGGGPNKYTAARPYSSINDPDQRGFRNYEWYSQIASAIAGTDLPIHLLGAGSKYSPHHETEQKKFAQKPDEVVSIARLAAREQVFEQTGESIQLDPIPDHVSSVNFWFLSAQPGNFYENLAWYPEPDHPNVVAVEFRKWAIDSYKKDEALWREKKKMMNLQENPSSVETKARKILTDTSFFPRSNSSRTARKPLQGMKMAAVPAGDLQVEMKQSIATQPPAAPPKIDKSTASVKPTTKSYKKPINHYLLLPTYEWGVSDWHLDVIRPFVKKHRVTIGFSIKEAVLARKVTVVGNKQSFSDELLDKMRSVGCEVERIQGDGTSIASQLATR